MARPKPCNNCGKPILILKNKKRDGTQSWMPVEVEGVAEEALEYDWKKHTPHWKVCTAPSAVAFREQLERQRNAKASTPSTNEIEF